MNIFQPEFGLGVNCLTLFQLGKNKLTGIVAAFLLFSVTAGAQTGNNFKYRFNGNLQDKPVIAGEASIVINYNLPELAIDNITNDNGIFFRLSAPGHTSTQEPGKPELPVFSRLISIPVEAKYIIRITEIESARITPSINKIKGRLYPAQHGEIKQDSPQKPGFVIDRKLYSGRGLLKGDTVRIEKVGRLRGNDLSTLVISPVKYNPASNSLEVITSMKIEISWTGGIPSYSKSSPAEESALFANTLEKGVLNYYPGEIITGYSDQPVEMIIVTDTSYSEILEPFLRWKRQKGYRVNVLYYGEGLAGSHFSELKESISNLYTSSKADGHAPEYLLIIGDVSKIPYYGTGNVTDMYYGEFDGSGDFLPDMYIGRIPAKDTASVRSVVGKIIEYEKFMFADTNRFYSNALALAGKDASYSNYMNGQVKYAVSNYLTPANRINPFYFYYPEGFTKKDSVMKLISGGLSFINYSGHGTSAGWLHIDIKSPDIKNLTNKSRYPFIISNACRTAQFNDTASFGNKMLVSRNKGAIGFIGCTNDSYWEEDFIWAVGQGTPNDNPKYSETGLGALDRLFHTHGELPSDWYINMGQVNYAGNLAVSATSSLKKKYYWETYAVIGDPSVIPIIGTPLEFDISLPDTLPRGISSWSLTAEPFSYVAISDFENLWDASFASPSGAVDLSFPSASADSCLVVITGQNRIPIIKTIYFATSSQGYLNLSSSAIDDATGNNNGFADYGETFYLRLKIGNLGMAGISDLTASISSDSEWITINNSTALIPSLPGRSEITLDNTLQLTLDENVPDQGIVTIDLILKDNQTEKKYRIDITLHAPRLEIINCIIDDSVLGNNNAAAEPGENFTLIFQVRNLGTSSTSGQFSINPLSSRLEIIDSDLKSGTLQFGIISEIPVEAKLSESSQYGDYIKLQSILDCSPYIVNKDFVIRVGRVRESFESSSFRTFPWINLSEKPWVITQTSALDGIVSARSGIISHNASSSLLMRTFFEEADTVKFYIRVSSELNYDYFLFSVNGNEIIRRSGETTWEKIAVPVEAGINVLEWTFKKDNSVSQGGDGAWIDLIDFSRASMVNYIRRDLEVARIESPQQKDVYGQEIVSVKVLNPGRDTINSFFLAYTVNNRQPVIEQFKQKIAPFQDSVTVEFERRADLDLSGTYEIRVYGFGNDDDYLLNDTLKISVVNTEVSESATLFPNPFTDRINLIINSKTDRAVRVTVTNTAGRQVISLREPLTAGENQIILNTSHLSPGIYIVNIDGHNAPRAYSLIKIKR